MAKISAILLGTITLIVIAQFNYLFFHSIAEMMSIQIAILFFVLGTETYKLTEDHFLLFLGKAYMYLALLNIFHLLTYHGMGVFDIEDPNIATQFWISLRLLNAITFLIAPIFTNYKIPKLLMPFGYGLWVILSIISIMILEIFPKCFVVGQGLTTFKIYTEYVIILILCIAILHLRKYKNQLSKNIYKVLLIGMSLNVLTELFFTQYNSPYGLVNLLGHICEIYSLMFIYIGFISRGLNTPFETIFSKLTDSNNELIHANRYKSDFLASISHEMRTPLTAVLAFSEDLLQEKVGVLNPTQKEHIYYIQTNSKNLLYQINDILDFSKIEAGKMALELSSVYIHQLITEEANLLRSIALKKRIQLEYHKDSKEPIIADEHKIRQVIRNLLSNALKFSACDSLVTISLQDSIDPPEGILLEVRDHGIGISLDEQEKVFDAFYQVDHQLNRKYAGTGLGLALVKKIVSLHFGRIWVNSCEGIGATFYVYLPYLPEFDKDLE